MHPDLLKEGQALVAPRQRTRRHFLVAASAAGLAGGFATAAQPVLAQAIQTDFSGIEGKEVVIDSHGTQLPAYVSRPDKRGDKPPVIIVVSEIFGVHEYIADVTRRLAKAGYMAIAPEFFTRAGDPTELGTVGEILTQIVAKTPDHQVLSDIEAAIQWAAQHGGDTQRVGITGFCWGGRITWLACEKLAGINAGVAWYGRLVGEKSAEFPENPIDLAGSLKAPVLGLYGGQDTGIPTTTIDQMKAALTAAKTNPAALTSRVEIYPDAPHAFHADYRASYQADPARDGWAKTLKWFAAQGV